MQNDKYKYVSIVLGIVAIVFAYLYFTKPEPTASELYQSVSDKVTVCSKDLAEWSTKYSKMASSSEKQKAFDKVMENCKDVVGQGQVQLQ
jgi:hypothetical protein